jgi:hypothetical protein
MFINDGNINSRKNYFVNNIICNNTASVYGGGLYCDHIRSVNNIITNNTANYGGGIYCTDGTLNIFNSILWGNRANNSGNQLSIYSFDHVNFYNSVLEEGIDGIGSSSVLDYENMIETNPYFISPSQGAGINYNGLTANWQLQAKSPCIDSGTQRDVSYDFEYPEYDLIGNDRMSMDTIDIGPYEFINVAPVKIANIADQQYFIGQGNLSINCDVFFDENIGDSIGYTIGDSDIPDWMNIDLLYDNINITGSPNSDDLGTSSLIVLATDLFGESTSDTFNITVTEPNSVEEIVGIEYKVYPIPATEHINIELTKTNILNKISIDLYDVNGRLINSNIYYMENVINIDVQNLNSGIYYLVIEHNDSVKRYKIPICN